MDRLPPSPAEIQTIILDFYTPRGLTPNILLKLDELVRSVSITDTARIARILLPAELKNFTLAQEIEEWKRKKDIYKYVNWLGIPILLALFGILRWRLRLAKKAALAA